jgi:hypothetical protein
LINACPPLVGDQSNYNLRNIENIAIPMGKRTVYVNSFIPSTVRAWNNLDINIRNCNSVDSFKYQLKKKRCRKKNKLYSKFSGRNAINHTRIRLRLSGLKAQRHAYKHVLLPTCDFCSGRKEDEIHFLLQCRAFSTMRINLVDEITSLYRRNGITLDLSRTIIKKELVNSLLKGDQRLNEVENSKLFIMVQQYISSSKRF